MSKDSQQQSGEEIAVFGGGCFWCTEAIFSRLKGVNSVLSGYAGGQRPNPTYEQVSTGVSGHAEVVKIAFDPEMVSYQQLLEVFFETHNPTTLNQQGADVGTQYRSIIFATNNEQLATAQKYIAGMKNNGSHIVTELQHLSEFFTAEAYHHRYYDIHKEQPYCQFVIGPKLEKLEHKFVHLLK